MEIQYYQSDNGKEPFFEWLRKQHLKTKAILLQRIDRLRRDNLGKYRELNKGLFELKINHGPGYRIYCGRAKNTLVIVLCGGSKKSQQQDIKKAKVYWQDYLDNR